ncbi:MAG: MoaD/ThiS family protein [Actinomycetota bacterium]|nr:MoaD/ThiS family protein [Actinomycetota bacterium]
MSTTVRIPTQLRTLTDGADQVTARGVTIAELIVDLESAHPGIRQRLLDKEGKLRRFVNLYVGDEDVRLLKGLDTPVPEGTEVLIIPAVAGG